MLLVGGPRKGKGRAKRSRKPSLGEKFQAWVARQLQRHHRHSLAKAAESGLYILGRIRRLSLRRTTFVAVTGSCGKTTTARLAWRILSFQGRCYRKCGRNSLRDSVRTLLMISGSSRYCVQEVSAFPLGEIAKQVKLVRPHIAVVTTIGSDHYKCFRGLEATAREKGRLVESLRPDGIAILNADDPHVSAMAVRTRARVITFGLCPDADVRGSEITSSWPDRLALTVSCDADKVRVQTKLVGEYWTTSVLAAIACGIVCGVDLQTCAKAVEIQRAAFGRCSVHSRSGKPIYVLDTQKAPFWTMDTGLAFVEHARASRKTIVVGTISDYAGSCGPKYRNVARRALAVADRVVFVGPRAGHVSKLRQGEAQDRLHCFESSLQASVFLERESHEGELIYIKASRRDHLERIMLSQLDRVVCWRERCGRLKKCQECNNYRKPSRPPKHTLTPELKEALASAQA